VLADATESARPVLNTDIIDRLQQLGSAVGEDLLGDLAALFLADADVQITDLRCAIANHDPAGVVWSAHAMRGAGANLGATALADLCASLEIVGTTGNVAPARPLFDALQTELDHVRVALRALSGVPIQPAL
jgi:two-component system sensor histidine kinase/response regulator